MKGLNITLIACMIGAFIGFAFIGHVTWERVIIPNSPTMVLDMNAPCTNCEGLKYYPAQVTGIPLAEGKVVMVSCKVPDVYLQYIDYPDTWGKYHPFNPNGVVGPKLVIGLYVLLGISIILLTWSIIKKRREIACALDKITEEGNNQ